MAGRVTVGPPGVTVGAGVVGTAAVVGGGATVVTTNWVGVAGKGVADGADPLLGLTRARNPAQ